MKIKPEHYTHMRDTIRAAFTPEQVQAHRDAIISEGKAKDVEKRVRWDLSHAAKLTPWVCANLYSYMDDSHIDTALRAIVREVY